MFILAVPPRPLIAPEQVSETQFVFKFPAAPGFSHITLALGPGQTIPVDLAAAVYYSLPSAPAAFRFIGYLGQGRDSATYRIISHEVNPLASGMRTDGEGDVLLDDDAGGAGVPPGGVQGVVTIGVSVEPAAQVAGLVQQMKADQEAARASGKVSGVSKVETKVLAQRIIGNAFNFLSSFGSEQIPLKAFQDWWKKFEGKVERDPSFLERPQD